MDQIVGQSVWTDCVQRKISQVARYTSSVLITGPSGTGKELIARSIHLASPRFELPFIPVDCASIPGTLFSSQLFGHNKGAFTGASASSLGCFRAADGGTIFLDEIGELDMECQSKLLRVIQERCVTPLGSHESIPIDVRIVAATNRDLKKEVDAGRFRLDLYYRLDVISVESAALKDRVDDIRPLAEYFLNQMITEREMPRKQFSADALRMMEVYDWPGNVRQLQNIIERAMVLCESPVIGPEWIPSVNATALPDPLLEDAAGDGAQNGRSLDGWQTFAELEEDHLRRTLEVTHYNQSAAARVLDIDYRLLVRRMKKYGLKKNTSTDSTSIDV